MCSNIIALDVGIIESHADTKQDSLKSVENICKSWDENEESCN